MIGTLVIVLITTVLKGPGSAIFGSGPYSDFLKAAHGVIAIVAALAFVVLVLIVTPARKRQEYLRQIGQQQQAGPWVFAASDRTTQDKLRLLAAAEAALPWQDGVRYLERASHGGPQASGNDQPTQRDDGL